MDGSICTDESSTGDTASISAGAAAEPGTLCRMVSGGSVVLDPETGIEAESSGRKLPSSKFKGVVPQPNGRWGAQIYEKHQRVWLGTFNEEAEAARSYDVAALRFRGRDAVTNFKPPTTQTQSPIAGGEEQEAAFLNSHSKAEIVDMLRKHTYADELEQSKKKAAGSGRGGVWGAAGSGSQGSPTGSDRVREQLFEKAVTPSDVGKLNRLVIPKQHAEKHFPLPAGTAASKGVLLNLEDATGKVWRFRYSYWNSSQSYVLTKGWSRFVKEKSLAAGDIVGFHRSAGPEKQLYIDWKARNSAAAAPAQPPVPVQVVRLFGVNIFNLPELTVGKRMREAVDPSERCEKQQRIIGAW